MLLPALTFLIGLALGAVIVWVGVPSGDNGASTAPRTPSATVTVHPSTAPAVGAGVPPSCMRAGKAAQTVVTLVEHAVGAVRDFDAQRLERIVQRLQSLDHQVRQDVQACRSAATGS